MSSLRQELSKTPDHAAARTYYLFNVDIKQVARKLLENSYKVMMRLFSHGLDLLFQDRQTCIIVYRFFFSLLAWVKLFRFMAATF